MAVMYPEVLDPEQIESGAEIFMFEQFKKQLDNSFHVFHNVTWTGNRNLRGECDFVIFKRDRGFLTLEVKGGRIENIDNAWFSVNRYGQRIRIKDPVHQARYAQYAFRDLYRNHFKLPFSGIFSWGVCFPEAVISDNLGHRDLNEHNVLHAGTLDHIYDWIQGLFDYTRPQDDRRLTREEGERFLSLFKGNMVLHRSMLFAMRRQQEELESVDRFQDYLLNLFDDKRRVGFQGAAGTGKTWLAVKKTMRLADEGKHVLFLCFSSNLRYEIIRKLGGLSRVTIETFHTFALKVLSDFLSAILDESGSRREFISFMHRLYMETGEEDFFDPGGDFLEYLRWISKIPCDVDLRAIFRKKQVLQDEIFVRVLNTLLPGSPSDSGCSENRDFFSDRLPSALEIIFHEYTLKDTFDAIVIDEAQDFEDKWCDCIDYFFTNRDERFIYIFYDDNQSIFQPDTRLPVVKLLASKELGDYIFRLKNNLRNTPSILDFAVKKTGLGATAIPLDMSGIDPMERDFSSRGEAALFVEETVRTLLQEHQLSRSMITILSNLSFENSALAQTGSVCGYRLEAEIMTHSKGIRFRTISQFKGLESDVVILLLDYAGTPGEQHHNITDELIYVGCTRAKYLLYVANILSGT
ncbi:NERD domain-containing protein [Marispirochaeta sp.]|uniref:nuclease-related domain-containing DEAD/DEAH box helicase n=1 Tax=Marispirochaeta sp. TaxID=2038653 RepID=UPI00374A925B